MFYCIYTYTYRHTYPYPYSPFIDTTFTSISPKPTSALKIYFQKLNSPSPTHTYKMGNSQSHPSSSSPKSKSSRPKLPSLSSRSSRSSRSSTNSSSPPTPSSSVPATPIRAGYPYYEEVMLADQLSKQKSRCPGGDRRSRRKSRRG